VLPEVMELPVPVVQLLRFAPFFVLGAWLGPVLVQRVASARMRSAIAVALAAFALWLAAALAVQASGAGYWSVAALPAALAGSLALLALSAAARGSLGEACSALGRASMAIYVLHVLFVAGARIALHKLLGVTAPGLILPLALAAGIFGPLAVRAVALRLQLARPLGLQ
jgi:peptidoglycan/LPS O-acetylase OafA/YrhL